MRRNFIVLFSLLAVAVIFTACGKAHQPMEPAENAKGVKTAPARDIPVDLAAKIPAPKAKTLGTGIPRTIVYQVNTNPATTKGIYYYTDAGWQYLEATGLTWTTTVTLSSSAVAALYVYTTDGSSTNFYLYITQNGQTLGDSETGYVNYNYTVTYF
jgi:hypothetical protein